MLLPCPAPPLHLPLLLAAAADPPLLADATPAAAAATAAVAAADGPALQLLEFAREFAREGVPYSPSVIGPTLSELRESINGVLLDVRLLSLYLNAGVFALALICGLLLGDQSRPDLPRDEREGDDGLYRTMPAARAATWDRGGPTFRGGGRGALSERSSLPPPPPPQKFVDELRPSRGAFTAVSAGRECDQGVRREEQLIEWPSPPSPQACGSSSFSASLSTRSARRPTFTRWASLWDGGEATS